MVDYGLDVHGGGVTSPLSEYSLAVSESFPRISRPRSVEASIAGRCKLDILPINLDGNKDGINDTYLEFRIPGTSGQFLDLSTLSLELRVSISKGDGTKLTDSDHVVFVNGLSNTMFKSCTCYINEQLVESSALFNYHSFLKMITTLPQEKIDSLGHTAFFRNEGAGTKSIPNVFTQEFFTSATTNEKEMMTACKEYGLSMRAPLLMDISSLDAYLLDSVDVRIRLELASKSWILNTDQDGDAFRFKLESARLWVDRVMPHVAAMESLNESLLSRSLSYTFTRSLYKTYVLPANQTSLIAELPFSQIIPQNLLMAIVDMNAMQGRYDKNGLYFSHADLSHVHITINGSTVYNIRSAFPHHTAGIYYSTLEALGLETRNSLTFQAFKAGRTVCAFNFVTEDIENGIPLEKSGNLRISLSFAQAQKQNLIIIFFAETLGLIDIDSRRHVKCIVRA